MVSSQVRNSAESSSTKRQPTLFRGIRLLSEKETFVLLGKEGKQPAPQMGRLWKNEAGAGTVPLGFFCLEEGSAQKESGPLCGVQLLLPMLGSHGDEHKGDHRM